MEWTAERRVKTEVPTSDPLWAVENHSGNLSRNECSAELAVRGMDCGEKGGNREVLLEPSDQSGLNR